MSTADGTRGTVRRRTQRVFAIACLLAAGAVGCVVDEPTIETTGGPAEATATATPEPTAVVEFEPTATPAPATPTPEPTPEPTSTPEPTPTPMPTGPTPLPESTDDAFEPTTVEAGLVAVPVRGASFVLDEPRPILQLPGHTLIYLDDERQGEVDIFVPAGDRDGNPLTSVDEVANFIESDATFSGVSELTAVSIAGLPTRVFEGTGVVGEKAFLTDLAAENEQLGWFPPLRMRMWLIDHPDGPVIVSAESLEDPGRYSDAVRLATAVLSTITFS